MNRLYLKLLLAIAALLMLTLPAQAQAVTTMPTLQPTAAPPSLPEDGWWPTYAHDQQRTGRQPLSQIAVSNVDHLVLRWKYHVPTQPQFSSSPIIGRESVYIGSTDGIFRALDLRTGQLRWQAYVGDYVRMTPAIHNNVLFVGTRPPDSQLSDPKATASLYALDPSTGAVKWVRRSFLSALRSEPVFVDGQVIEGLAGGDPPLCHQGGVFALDEETGVTIWSWQVSSVPRIGGAVWSPLSYDGRLVFFGTGNICSTIESTYANGVVAMRPDGTVVWHLRLGLPADDDDTGGGILVAGQVGYVSNKNGNFYAIDLAAGTIRWMRQLTDVVGLGSIGTPSTDGNLILISSGYSSDKLASPATPGAFGGGLDAFDREGNVAWQIHTLYPINGYAAISNDIAFVDADTSLQAISMTSGKTIWSSQSATQSKAVLYGSPAMTASEIVYADMSGTVYCFALQ